VVSVAGALAIEAHFATISVSVLLCSDICHICLVHNSSQRYLKFSEGPS
jgi:hypothetical protein